MQRIGEIHTAPPPLQCLCSQSRIRQCDARQTGKGGESGADPLAAEPITAPQHPFGFQQHGGADVDILIADQRTRLRKLFGIVAGQVLLTLRDTEERRRYLNARATLGRLFTMRAIPIINENDTVATSEIRYGDNDRLAARVATMTSAVLSCNTP